MIDASDSTVVRARISVSGRVQGVGYRAFTVRVATQRGLLGGVRNCDDGRVELEAEGLQDRILSLIEELKVGPPASRVTAVQVEWVTATGRDTGFRVWY
jgi:acylphosphatase